MARLKNILLIGRIFLGMAFGIYGYLHFTYTAQEVAMLPGEVGERRFWVIFIGICWWAVAFSFFTDRLTRISGVLAALLLLLILFFVVFPTFHGPGSWLSTAAVFGLIGGAFLVSANGKGMRKYKRKNV